MTLCGILISELELDNLDRCIDEIKDKYWGSKKIIFHSYDIRNRSKKFKNLNDPELRRSFFNDLNNIFDINFKIIASSIDKRSYKTHNYSDTEDIYDQCLLFILERVVKDFNNKSCQSITIILEKRNKIKDTELATYLNDLFENGGRYIKTSKLKSLNMSYKFSHKNENENGLQVSDLTAYPISKYVLDENALNIEFDILKKRFRTNSIGAIEGYGLKIVRN